MTMTSAETQFSPGIPAPKETEARPGQCLDRGINRLGPIQDRSQFDPARLDFRRQVLSLNLLSRASIAPAAWCQI